MLWTDAWVLPSWTSLGGAGLGKRTRSERGQFDYESLLVWLDDRVCRSPSTGWRRDGRRQLSLVLIKYVFDVLIECIQVSGMSILACQRRPRLGRYHAKVVALGTRIIGGIVRRCLWGRTYCTILGLCRWFLEKPDGGWTSQCDGAGQIFGATSFTAKVGYFWCHPPRGIDGDLQCGGMINGEEGCKASLFMPDSMY